jgi:GTP-binding protein
VVGIVETPDYERFVVADLPGLIQGAHEGKGLGDEFLRHVERTRLLVHLVDAAPPDGSDPVRNYRAIRDELRLHDGELGEEPEIVVANKMDLDGAAEGLGRLREALGERVMPVSATEGTGLAELVQRLAEKLRALPEQERASPEL